MVIRKKVGDQITFKLSEGDADIISFLNLQKSVSDTLRTVFNFYITKNGLVPISYIEFLEQLDKDINMSNEQKNIIRQTMMQEKKQDIENVVLYDDGEDFVMENDPYILSKQKDKDEDVIEQGLARARRSAVLPNLNDI